MTSTRSALYASEGPDLVHYAIDLDGTSITRRATLALPATLQYAWPHPSGRYLYVASSNGDGEGPHHLIAFRIAPDGALSPHGDPVALPWRPLNNTVDATGRHVITAYARPSAMMVHRIQDDGRIGEAVPQPHYLSAGVFPHQVRMLPSNRHVIQTAHGIFPKPGKHEEPGSLLIYSFDEGVLKLQDIAAPNGGFGFTPRHLDIHPAKPWAYVVLELQNELQMFSIDNQRLSPGPVFARSTLADPKNHQRPRQIVATPHVHPNGRFVYVANRADASMEHDGQKVFGGGENNIAVFAIDQTTGEPTLIQHAEFPGIHARCFALDPTGRVLIAAARNDMNVLDRGVVRHLPRMLTVYRIGSDGRLTQANNYEVQSGSKPQIWMGIVGLAQGEA